MIQLDQKYSPIYLPEHNATIFRVPMAAVTGELVIPNAEDDGYSVYLAETLTDAEAMNKAEHAIYEHIKNHHHGMGADVQQLEAEAHHLEPAPAPAAPKPEKPVKKLTHYPKRVFSALELSLLKHQPEIARILGIKPEDIPKKPTRKR